MLFASAGKKKKLKSKRIGRTLAEIFFNFLFFIKFSINFFYKFLLNFLFILNKTNHRTRM